jgi:glycosyltransferase involved in cell wall biosynthesis
MDIVFCAAAEKPPAKETFPDEVFMAGPDIREPRRIWMSLAARPWGHFLLHRWVVRTYRPLLRILERRRPRVVHFVGSGWDFLGFAMHALARRVGARFTIWPAVHPGQWGDDRIDLRLYQLADAVFCQSEFEGRHLIARGLNAGRILRCGLPPMCRTDGDAHRLRASLKIGDRPAVLFLGRRDEGKGYQALMEAWSKVLVSHPQAVLMLAGPEGDGIPIDLPEDSFRDLGMPDEKQKADALAACDVFCLPSAHESFGIVYAEAWSYGKPVICGPAPASREWIRNGENGLWSDQSSDGIAGAVGQLLGDEKMRIRLGESGRVFQRENLTWEVVTEAHLRGFSAKSAPSSS